MKVSAYIAHRLRANGDEMSSRSPSTVIAVVGIAVSVAVMVLSISIVVGFQNEIRQKVVGFGSEVTIHAADAGSLDGTRSDIQPILNFGNELHEIISDTGCFNRVELSFDQPTVLKTSDDFEGIVIKGIDNGSALDFIKQNIIKGDADGWDNRRNSLILSRHIAEKLMLDTADRVDAAFIIADRIRLRRYTVAAIYDTHFSDYDKLYAFVPLFEIQQLNHVDSMSATQIDLHLKGDVPHSSYDIDHARESLQQSMMYAAYSDNLPGAYRVTDINQSGAMYFNWLALLDTNVVVILIIMAIVSGFTLVSSLFIIILQRVRTIGILKSLGASSTLIRNVFVLIGWRLVVYGIVAGDLLAMAILLPQKYFHLIPLNPEAYYLNYVPVDIDVITIFAVNVGMFLLSWLLLLVPARSVSSVSPASTMRYE